MIKTKSIRANTVYYLASPYTSGTAYVKNLRYISVAMIAAHLATKGYIFFCPIIQSHWIAYYGEIGNTSWEYWENFDTEMLTRCDALLVATLPGWEKSIGVQAEIQIAKDLKKPIKYVDDDGHVTKEPHGY